MLCAPHRHRDSFWEPEFWLGWSASIPYFTPWNIICIYNFYIICLFWIFFFTFSTAIKIRLFNLKIFLITIVLNFFSCKKVFGWLFFSLSKLPYLQLLAKRLVFCTSEGLIWRMMKWMDEWSCVWLGPLDLSKSLHCALCFHSNFRLLCRNTS